MHERQQKHNHFDEDDKIKLTSKATTYKDNKAKNMNKIETIQSLISSLRQVNLPESDNEAL